MAHLTKQALAASTRKTYKIGVRSFLRFCRRLSLSPFPAEHSTVCLFATFLSRKVGYQTVKTYLAALSCWHKSNGYPDPCSSWCHQSPTSAHHSRHLQSQSPHSSPEGAAAHHHPYAETPMQGGTQTWPQWERRHDVSGSYVICILWLSPDQ